MQTKQMVLWILSKVINDSIFFSYIVTLDLTISVQQQSLALIHTTNKYVTTMTKATLKVHANCTLN